MRSRRRINEGKGKDDVRLHKHKWGYSHTNRNTNIYSLTSSITFRDEHAVTPNAHPIAGRGTVVRSRDTNAFEEKRTIYL